MVEDFLGQYTIKIGSKRRIILPAKAKVEKNEEFMVLNSTLDNEAVLWLYGKAHYLEMLKKYEEFRKHAETEEEYLRLTEKINEIYLSVERICQADYNGRITLPESSVKYCDLQDYVKVIGMGNSILLRKPKNAR